MTGLLVDLVEADLFGIRRGRIQSNWAGDEGQAQEALPIGARRPYATPIQGRNRTGIQADVRRFVPARGRRDRTCRAAKPFRASNASGIACGRKGRCNGAVMSTKSRQVIYGSRIEGAEIRAKGAREAARK